MTSTHPLPMGSSQMAITIGSDTSAPREIVLSKPVRTRALLGNPAPLGLLGFALTAFVLSCHDAGFLVPFGTPHSIVTGLAAAYGGLAQLLAGLLAFQAGDTFGGTAFCSYGAFWLSLAVNEIPAFGVSQAIKSSAHPGAFNEAMGLYFLAWTLFTLMMLSCNLRTNVCTVMLFLSASLTFSLLTTAAFTQDTTIVKADGISGLITAAISSYLALAQLVNKQDSIFELPVGQLGTPCKKE